MCAQSNKYTRAHKHNINFMKFADFFHFAFCFVWYFYFPVSQLFYLYFMHGSVNDVVKAAEVSFVYPVKGAKGWYEGNVNVRTFGNYINVVRNLHKKGQKMF